MSLKYTSNVLSNSSLNHLSQRTIVIMIGAVIMTLSFLVL